MDRLHFAHQADVARFLGYNGSDGFLPIERMMRDLNSRVDGLARAADGFWEHLSDDTLATGTGLIGRVRNRLSIAANGSGRGEPPDVARDGRLLLPTAPFAQGPADVLGVLGEAGRKGLRVGHDFVRQARAAITDARRPFEWSPPASASLIDMLRAGDRSAALLETASASGLLSGFIPEWESVRYLAHHDVYHLHTVDHHTALVVGEISELRSGVSDADQFTVSLADEIVDYDPLLLAALLHDIGKGVSGDHTETGATIAAKTCSRLGLDAAIAADVEFLVRQHLSLARAATRRDLDDMDMLTQLATTIGTADRARMLYVLTYADSIRTGPSAWTEWKAALMRDLTLRLLRALAEPNGVVAHNLEDRVVARVASLRRALSTEFDHERLDGFLASMPAVYLLAQTPEQVSAHLRLRDSAAFGPFVRSGGEPPTAFTMNSRSSLRTGPGLLWRVCGVFALHGVSILESRIYTDREGAALDVFRLDDAFEPAIGDEKRSRIDRDLAAVLDGRLSLGYRLAKKLQSYREIERGPSIASSVNVDNASSERYTLVEVRARDRLGLLYSIARAMSDLQLDIHIAKLATRGNEAIDVFYVRDGTGGKAVDPEFTREIERAILFELESLGLALATVAASTLAILC